MKSIRNMTAALFIFFSLFVSGQSNPELSEQLWNRVQKCYSQFADMDGDGELDYSEIDDSPNGYLRVFGDWPTCGCSCNSIVRAYKAANGEYTLLQREEFSCNWGNSVSSNRRMSEILPENFCLNAFSKDEINTTNQFTAFYLDVEIPRVGTETKFNIKLIPFGLFIKSDSLLTYNFSDINQEQDYWRYNTLLYEIQRIAKRIKDENTLNLLLNLDYDAINEFDMSIIEQSIGGKSWEQFESVDVLSGKLKILRNVFDIYLQLEFTSVVMEWNPEEARFFIKSKVGKPADISFKAFLEENEFWAPIC